MLRFYCKRGYSDSSVSYVNESDRYIPVHVAHQETIAGTELCCQGSLWNPQT